MTEPVTLTAPDGTKVQIDPAFCFGEAGDEAPIPFAVDGEVFFAASAIPAEDYGQLAALFANMPKTQGGASAEDVSKIIEITLSGLELFLLPESAERLAARMKDKVRPVGVDKVMEIATQFLNNVYTKGGREDRPTTATPDND